MEDFTTWTRFTRHMTSEITVVWMGAGDEVELVVLDAPPATDQSK